MKNLPKKQMARLKKKILKMAQSGKNINDFKIAIEENAVYFLDNDICKHCNKEKNNGSWNCFHSVH